MDCAPTYTPVRESPVVLVCELSPNLSDDPASTPGETVVDRLLHYGQKYEVQHQERLHAAEQQRLREEQAMHARQRAARHAHTNGYYQRHTAEEIAAHRAARVERDSERQAALQAAATRAAPHQPTLTTRSVALAARRRAKEGLENLSPSEVQARRQEAAEKAREKAAEQRERENAQLGVPVISARAQAIRHLVPASERLYQHAREVQHDDAIAGIERQLREVTNIMKTSKPQITARAAALPRRDEPIHEQLYAKAAEKDVQRERLAQTYDTSSEWFRPKIDPTSELLTQQLPHTAAERLYGREATQHGRPIHDPRAAEMTFQPHINPPRRGAHAGPMASCSGRRSVVSRTQVWDTRRETRLHAQAAERRAEEERQCTFRPTITAKASRLGSLSGSLSGSFCGSLYSSASRVSEQVHTDPTDPTAPMTWRCDQPSRSSSLSSAAAVRQDVAMQRSRSPDAASWCESGRLQRGPVVGGSRHPVEADGAPWGERDELMRIAYEALAEADAVSHDLPLDDYY